MSAAETTTRSSLRWRAPPSSEPRRRSCRSSAATSEAYFNDPKALERSGGGKDEMLGFGVDAAVVLVTPVALTVAKDVIGFLGDAAARARPRAGRRGRDRQSSIALVRASRHDRSSAEAEPELDLTDEQLEQVRALAIEKGRGS